MERTVEGVRSYFLPSQNPWLKYRSVLQGGQRNVLSKHTTADLELSHSISHQTCRWGAFTGSYVQNPPSIRRISFEHFSALKNIPSVCFPSLTSGGRVSRGGWHAHTDLIWSVPLFFLSLGSKHNAIYNSCLPPSEFQRCGIDKYVHE